MHEAVCQALCFPNMLMLGRSCLLKTSFKSFPEGNALLGEMNCLFLTTQDIMPIYLIKQIKEHLGDETKGISFAWMNYGTGGRVTIFFFIIILLLNEALKLLPGRIFFQVSFLTLEWL